MVNAPAALGSRMRAYLLALAATAGAIVATMACGPALARAPYLLLLPAVMISSWVGGLGPGLFSTSLGTIAAEYFLIAPVYSVTLDTTYFVQLSAFVCVAMMVSGLNSSRIRALGRAHDMQAHLELLVGERTRALSTANESLLGEIERRKRTEVEREEVLWKLGERVKELTVLHSAARLVQEEKSVSATLADMVALLPSGWLHPDITTVRLGFGDVEEASPGFRPSPWMQREEYHVSSGESGFIEVACLEHRYDGSDGPFLPEERVLVHSLASLLASHFERLRRGEERVQLALEHGARVAAEAENQRKDLFLATVSHELRRPLTAILGWARMLRMEATEDRDRGLAVIERCASMQGDLLDELIDLARIVSGRLRIATRDVDLRQIITNSVDVATPAAWERHVTLDMSLPAAETFIKGDPIRLQQVFGNLIANALKFTPAGGAASIALRHETGSAVITIEDNGIGMDRTQLAHLFEPYWQAGAQTSRADGLGLGLSIVRQLVELHGGAIVADSPGEGRGTQLTVTLPLATGLAQDSAYS